MQPAQMLAQLLSDGKAMVAAARDLDETVPSCPGWTVRDALLHTGEVYAHKRVIIEQDLDTAPEPWPPVFEMDDVREWFDEQLHALVEALRTRDPLAHAWTWYPPDQSVGFWVRRMMQETVIHRADVELAFGDPAPIDDDVALDGIDELLACWLVAAVGDYHVAAGSGQRIAIDAGQRAWTVALDPDRARLTPGGADEVDATISGAPGDLLLALWNRLPYEHVTTVGDESALAALRAAAVAITQ